ncbi:MAG: hypothetical protein C0511_19685, partial [Hyphomicrobium sp.]|nr:hypothetical protein [Hyphomicrobium sp.]
PYHDELGRFTTADGAGGGSGDLAQPAAFKPRGGGGKAPAPPAPPPTKPAQPAPQPPDQPDFLAKRPGSGKLTGSLDGLTPAEQNFAKEMIGLGKNVEIIPTATGRTPDFQIDGVQYELKTVSGVQKIDSDGLSSAISSRIMDGRGQASDIIVDARQQAGMDQTIAERAVGRAYGADRRGGINSITILTPAGVYSSTGRR